MDISFSSLDFGQNNGAIAFAITACVLVYFVLACLKPLLTRLLMTMRHVDGHMMSGAPIRMKSYLHDVNFFGREFSKRYGRVYHVWHGFTPVVILADVDAIRSFYKDHFAHYREPDMSTMGKNFEDTLRSCVCTAHGRERIKEYRGFFLPFFSQQAVSSLHTATSDTIDSWIRSLPVGEIVDLAESSMIDVILEVIASVCYGQETCSRHPNEIRAFMTSYNRAMTDNSPLLDKLGVPYLYHFLPRTRPASGVDAFNREWADFHIKLLVEREGRRGTQQCGLFFALHDQVLSGNINLSAEELSQTVCEIWLLNLDITYTVASLLFYDLAKNRPVQKKVQEELDLVLGGRDPAVLKNIQKDLPYLHMVMKESARMNPAEGVTFPEKTVKEFTDMAGYMVPKGTIVCIDPHSVNFDATYWPHPEVFDPERFAPGKSYVPYSLFRFGLGPRKCIGYRLALSIIALLTAKLLQKFDILPADKDAKLLIKTEGISQFTPYIAPPVMFVNRSRN